jgi:hypothetical protein
MALDTDSALLQLPDHVEEKLSQGVNHSMIVKFNTRNDKGYTSALERIRQFEKDAPNVVAARFGT